MSRFTVRTPVSRVDSSARRLAALAALALFVAPLADAGPLAAQEVERPGRIRGRVVTAEGASPVTSAEVSLVATEMGALTDVAGRYFLRDVPPGTYDLRVRALGHSTTTVTDVTVRPGETTTLDLTLRAEAIAVGDITVSAEQARGTAAAVLNRQKNSAAVTDGIGSAEIARAPVSNAAETANRLTGVTVSDDKYVYVRGLGARYSQINLNGSPLPSPEPEKGVVPLDLFPAGFLESLTVRKTYTPDHPADFSGGSVEIETREYPDYFTFKATLGTSLNSQSQFADGFLSYVGGGMDFLGIDDGTRDLPDLIKEDLGGLGGQQLPTDPESLERFGETFVSDDLRGFAPTSSNTPSNIDFGFSMGDRVELFGKDVGYFLSATYSNKHTLRDDEIEREWRASAFDSTLLAGGREIEPNVDYTFVRGIQNIDWGALGNFTLNLSPEHEISLKTLYNRSAEDEARQFQGEEREDITGFLRDQRLRFVARDLKWGQLSGEHKLGETRLEWRGTLAQATRDEPGLRETIFKRPLNADPSDPFLLDNEGPAPRYLFNELADDDLNGGVDWSMPLPLGGERPVRLKLGGFARVRNRDFQARRFRWQFRGDFTSLDSALVEENVVGRLTGPGQFALQEIFQPGDDYTTDDETYAGYGMVTVPLGPVEIVGGARVEDYGLTLDVRGGSSDESDAELSSTDVLPALNATLALTEDVNLRAAFSETLDRPEFRELAPFQFTEAISLRELFGNPDLEIADIRNWDLRWEWFPSPGEVVTVSGFYKQMDRPIEQVFIKTAGVAYSYQNADDAELYGAEVGFRKRLGFLHSWLEGFTLNGNAALLESEVRVSPEGVFDPTNLTRDLEGQADYTVNAGLTFQDPGDGLGTQASVSVNLRGERIVAAGGGGVPDIEEQPRAQLDLLVQQPISRSLSLKLKAENVLDAEYRWEQSANGITRVQRSYHVGRSFSASLTVGS